MLWFLNIGKSLSWVLLFHKLYYLEELKHSKLLRTQFTAKEPSILRLLKDLKTWIKKVKLQNKHFPDLCDNGTISPPAQGSN